MAIWLSFDLHLGVSTAAPTTQWQLGSLLDQWVHWAVVYDGTNLMLYRNGNQGSQGGAETNAVSEDLSYFGYTGAVRIGADLDSYYSGYGMLDDVALFNTALTIAQVQKVMSGNFNELLPRTPLSIQLYEEQVLVSWTVNLPGLKLQSTPGLSPPQWSDVATNAVQRGPPLNGQSARWP